MVSVGIVGLTYARTRYLVNPVSAVTLWWAGWLFVANLELVGIPAPSVHAQGLYLLMLACVCFGALLVPRHDLLNLKQEERQIYLKWRWIKLLAIPIGLVVLALGYKASTTYLTDSLLVSREEIFGLDGQSVLFPHKYVQILYFLLVRPAILAMVVGGIAFFIKRGDKSLVTWAGLLYMVDSIIMLGRKDIYRVVLLAAFALFIMVRGNETEVIKKARRYGTIGIVALVALILSVTTIRTGGQFDVAAIVQRYLIKYHTGGFSLFDLELQNPHSRLNQTLTYGRSTLGGIEQGVVIGLRQINNNINAASGDTGGYMSTFRVIGSSEGVPVYFNAFNTILYSLYIDGREFAVALFSTVYGWYVMKHFIQWRRFRRTHSLMISLLLASIGFLGLFNSPLEGPAFWFGLIIVFSFNRLALPYPEKETMTERSEAVTS